MIEGGQVNALWDDGVGMVTNLMNYSIIILFHMNKIFSYSTHLFGGLLFQPSKSKVMHRFLRSRCLLWPPKMELTKTFQKSRFSIVISCDLEVGIDYRSFLLFYTVVSQVYLTKIEGMTMIFRIFSMTAKHYRITGGRVGQSITQFRRDLKRAKKGLRNL